MPVAVTGAGRTDAGVHATGQVVSCATASSFPFERLVPALAATLPADLTVRAAAVVDAAFSARFSALERTYVYAIHAAPAASALLAGRAYHVWRRLDLERMQAAAAHLRGSHDFRSFCGVPPENGNTERTIHALEIDARADLIRVRISANGFVHRMVRTIVGTLLECGTGRRDPDALPAVLRARDRRAAGLCAPAHGLYLAGVRYPDFDSYREPPLWR